MNAHREGASGPVPVTYAAIGATQRADLLHYPPPGYSVIERGVRLGSGHERFEAARESLFAWGVQRGAGIEVRDVVADTGEEYRGVVFAADGSPLGMSPAAETAYGPDGELLVASGVSAVLRTRVLGLHVDAPVRVVYVIDEIGRAAFAYGTLQGHPVSGEEAFFLEHLDDDSVRFTVRTFSRPASWRMRLLWPIVRLVIRRTTQRFLRVLHPVGQV